MQAEEKEKLELAHQIVIELSPRSENEALVALNKLSDVVSAFSQAFFLNTFIAGASQLILSSGNIYLLILFIIPVIISFVFIIRIYAKLFDYHHAVFSRIFLNMFVNMTIRRGRNRLLFFVSALASIFGSLFIMATLISFMILSHRVAQIAFVGGAN
ncbi:hypothetical protein ABFT80_00765 [Mesorhizobium sp. SB112]|uniref:hypothetical protein n=1 Tax=Mesorhizobium sp. SB112 TaxID=3151853 RepID=UPI003266C36D